MKTKSLITMLLIFLAAVVNAQLPQNIKDAFNSKYPDATIKKFNHKQGSYIISFKSGNEKHNVTFNENGNWIQTITKMRAKEIPAPVDKVLLDKFGDWHVSKYFEKETPASTLYSVDIYYERSDRKGPIEIIEHNVDFTPSGNIVKNVKKY